MNFNWQEKSKDLHSELRQFFQSFPFESEIQTGKIPLAVACSGGADSLAVLLLTWANFPEAREHICVFHFDHAVRAESAADAAFVREVCANLGVEFVCERRVPAESNDVNSEADLRRARLDFFAREMRSRKIRILVQGHHYDDVAETLLMRLTRGAGTDGLAAPRKISRQADGRLFVRPLLDIPKKKILDALRRYEIPWREDSTNAGTDYFRNRIRNRVLPELRAAAPFENIARSRMLMEEDADALDFFANNFFEKAAENFSFENLPKAIVRRVVRKIFSKEKIETDGASAVDALVEALFTGTALKIQIDERKIICDKKRLTLVSPEKLSEKPVFKIEKIEVTEALFKQIKAGKFSPKKTVFLAGTPKIFVRELLPGEKFCPLGAPGEKSVRRIFIDKKIPQEQRKNLPVFADGTGIAWIPGLPPAERFRIRSAGTTALRLTYRNASLV